MHRGAIQYAATFDGYKIWLAPSRTVADKLRGLVHDEHSVCRVTKEVLHSASLLGVRYTAALYGIGYRCRVCYQSETFVNNHVDHAQIRSCVQALASVSIIDAIVRTMQLTIESQDPVHNDMASLLTPRQLTRLSCPWRVPTLSPRRTSQTCHGVSMGYPIVWHCRS